MAKGGGFKGGSKSVSKGGGGFSSSRRSFSSRSGSSFGRNSGGSSWSWSWGSSSGRGSWTSAAGPDREALPREFAHLASSADRDARGEGDLTGALGLAEEVSGAIGDHLDGQGHEGAARIWRWVTTAALLLVAVFVLINLGN